VVHGTCTHPHPSSHREPGSGHHDLLSAALFILSQLDYFLLSRTICKGSSHKVDGSFIATLLETAAVGVLYLAWDSITEGSWADDEYYG